MKAQDFNIGDKVKDEKLYPYNVGEVISISPFTVKFLGKIRVGYVGNEINEYLKRVD